MVVPGDRDPFTASALDEILDPNVFEDVTAEFLSSCEAIPLGDLVHYSYFSLFEAMSGIELMDSKMDSGLTSNMESRPPPLCWNDLNTDKGSKGTKVIIEICDTVLQSIVAFVQGDSLAQTVFTCLYLHDPACIQNPVLRLMCCGLLRLLEKVYTVINLAAIFEEEDINMTTYGFSLSPQISDKVLLSQLKSEIDKAKGIENVEVTQLALRFSIVFTMINCLNILVASNNLNSAPGNSSSGKQTSSPGANDLKTLPQTLDQVLQKLKKIKRVENVEELVEADFAITGYSKVLGFDSCLNQHLLPPTFPKAAAFPSWAKMVDYLTVCVTSLKEACILVNNSTNCYLSTVLNFVSCSSAAPKSNLLERSMIQCAIFALPSSVATTASKSANNGGAGVSSKPHLIGMPIEDLVAKSISSTVSHLPFSTDEESIGRVRNQFLVASVRPVAMLVKCYGKNRARLRERLIGANQELFQLESLCIALDNAVNSVYVAVNLDKGPLSHRVYSWLSLQASSVMQDFVFLGFELELYSEHELLYIFWYLADFLMIWSCSLQKERLEKFSDELLSRPSLYSTTTSTERPFFKTQRKEDQEASGSSSGGSGNHGKRNKQYQKLVKQREIEMATQSAMLYEVQAHQLKYLQSLLSLFCGYYKTLILLKAADKLMVVKEKTFDNEKLRFEHRFCPIALEPDCFPSYDLFSNAVNSHVESARKQPHLVLAQAADSFSDAKTLLTDIRTCSTVPHEAQLMFKISSNNLIVLNLVQKQLRSKMQKGELPSPEGATLTTPELKEKLTFKIDFEPTYSNWPVFKLDSR